MASAAFVAHSLREGTFAEFFPSLVVIGSNGAGESIAFDFRQNVANRIVYFDMTNIDLTDTIDGSKVKAVNNRDRNFTKGKIVQSAVDTETHLVVAHEVTNQGFDREQLSPMAIAAKAALGRDDLHAIAGKG